jgi:glycogen phosphorylase
MGLNLSMLDGWWDGAYDPQVGRLLGNGYVKDFVPTRPGLDEMDAQLLYCLLEGQVVPLFYDMDEKGRPSYWVASGPAWPVSYRATAATG